MLFDDGDDFDYSDCCDDDDDDDDYEMMRSRIQINHGKLAVCGPRQVGRYRQSSHLQIVTMMMVVVIMMVMMMVTISLILLIVMMTVKKKVEGGRRMPDCQVDCDYDYCQCHYLS